ncbi:hypothetical protein F5B22DRAFT_649969 [Xylaria bambusicola]|uniref:uncharacterized protein n=1 Tax=Xylaria bambusicola TaxID=326684 RepID=UPI002008629C|nr:uncharacterized protein F5B22DRAFT_649969 [Xylaria bambusicola]KAI0508476.1 hypothetical protein F5B22DRAFT_649969 [Xylaria bambusicola]
MGHSDPSKGGFPYPTKGVIFPDPPWEADFDGMARRSLASGFDEDGDYEMQDAGYLDDDENLDETTVGEGIGKVARVEETKGTAIKGSVPDPGTATFGIELEFLVVQCPKTKKDDGKTFHITDPHPNEPRYSSKKMAEWSLKHWQERQKSGEIFEWFRGRNGAYADGYDFGGDGDFRRARYSRTKLTRVLRDRGLVVIKWPEKDINPQEKYARGALINDFSESEDSDDEREYDYSNSSRLVNFSSVYDWVLVRGVDENMDEAVTKWNDDFDQYHIDNDINKHRTRAEDIEDMLEDRKFTVRGWPDPEEAIHQELWARLKERLVGKLYYYKQAREDWRNHQTDPLHVPVPGLKRQYKAWTVTIDLSVDGNGMTKERYANATSEDPWNEYFWFGAEVVSPVLAIGDERSYEAVRVACGALRDALRCHKPMEVSTGLHVHLGHTHGWTLLQAKRFAALWLLAEKAVLRLHRRDRDADTLWCAKISGSSRLWRALFSIDQQQRQDCANVLPANHPPRQRMQYDGELMQNVPSENIETVEKKFLQNLWRYDSITDLHRGLGESKYCRTGIKWRIRGKDISTERAPRGDDQPGTIEARIMHGTLDADNINNWVIVLGRIVHVVRDYSDAEFRAFLASFLLSRSPGQLLVLLKVPDEVLRYWMDPKRRDTQGRYWEYPDRDLVDWQQPFMVPGHKATHGSYWD